MDMTKWIMASKVCCKVKINSSLVFLVSYEILKTIGNYSGGIIGAGDCEKRHRLFQTSECDLLSSVTTDYISTKLAKRFTTSFTKLPMSHIMIEKSYEIWKFHTKYPLLF